MNFTSYQMAKPCPRRPRPIVALSIDPALSDAEAQKRFTAWQALKAEHAQSMIAYDTEFSAYNAAEAALKAQFQRDALEACGLAKHPRAKELFALAWNKYDGEHSSVYNLLIELSEALGC